VERNTDHHKLKVSTFKGLTIAQSEKDYKATQIRDVAESRGYRNVCVIHETKMGRMLDLPKELYEKERFAMNRDSLSDSLHRDEEFIERFGRIKGTSYSPVGGFEFRTKPIWGGPDEKIQKRPIEGPRPRKYYFVND
jgi:hypothetical protein